MAMVLISTPPDALAIRYRVAFEKTKTGREQWIEGTLELAVVMKDGHSQWSADQDFNRWIERNGLQKISSTDRSALNCFARDLVYARQLLEQSQSLSWQSIWRNRPERRLSGFRQPRPRPARRTIREQQRIPDVMREPPPERRAVVLRALTREQVDPNFEGSHLDFVAQYGHVNMHTKEQIEENKRQEALTVWLGAESDYERAGRAMLTALAAVNPTTLEQWKAKPAKAEKLSSWCDSARLAYEALMKIKGA